MVDKVNYMPCIIQLWSKSGHRRKYSWEIGNDAVVSREHEVKGSIMLAEFRKRYEGSFVRAVVQNGSENDIFTRAAALSLYSMMSVFPFIAILEIIDHFQLCCVAVDNLLNRNVICSMCQSQVYPHRNSASHLTNT